MNSFIQLFLKELKQEWRNRFLFSALLLFVLSTVFICYLSFKQITNIPTWNALWWIILLFTVVQSSSRSFMAESRGQTLFHYYLAHPLAILFSKMAFVTLLMLVVTTLGYLIYSLLLGNLVFLKTEFLIGTYLGATALSAAFTFVSSLAAKSGNNSTLMTILGLPIITPVLLIAIRMTKNAADGISFADNTNYFFGQCAMIVIIVALSAVLFPYISKE